MPGSARRWWFGRIANAQSRIQVRMNTTSHIETLNRRFGKDDLAQVVVGKGGLPMVRIQTRFGDAEIYLHGAHVTGWKPAGNDEVIFVSRESEFVDGKAIRGGVPICFPWFGQKAGDPKAPKHGFARLREWRLDSVTALDDGAVTLVCVLESDAATRELWPHAFCAAYRVTVGKDLRLELTVINTGSAALRFEEALHTYFHVGDVKQTRVRGLDGTAYLDKTEDFQRKEQSGDIEFQGEVDRVYLNTRGPVEVLDAALHRQLVTHKENSATTVVWNPWQELAESLADFGRDEWREMVAVEGSNVGAAGIVLEPGEEHSLRITLSAIGTLE